MNDDVMVVIRRNWNGFDRGTVKLRDLSGFHWTQASGGDVSGFSRVAPRPMVHAYAYCDDIDGLEDSHSCLHGPPPHRIKVVIVAKDNDRQLMKLIKQRADDREKQRRAAFQRRNTT